MATWLPPGWFWPTRRLVFEIVLDGNPVAIGPKFPQAREHNASSEMTGNLIATQIARPPSGDIEAEHSLSATGNQVASPVAIKRPALHVAA